MNLKNKKTGWLIGALLLFSLCAGAQKKMTSDDLLRAAKKSAFDRKDYPAAKRYLQTALKRSPDYSDVRIFLGRIYTWTDNYDSARMEFEYVLRRHPAIEDAALAYSDLNTYNDRYAEALDIVNNGLKYHPKSEALLIKKARIQAGMKDYDAADATLGQVLSINRRSIQADTLRQKYRDLAVTASQPEAPVVTGPTSDELLAAAKDAAFNQKNYPVARQLLLQALDKNPDYPDVRIFLGRLYTWSDMPDSGRMAFQYVLQRKPDNEDAALAYSDLETYNNRYPQALTIVENGLGYHPSSEVLLVKKARILAGMKDYAGADKVASQVLMINRSNAYADSLHASYQAYLTNQVNLNMASSDELFQAARKAAFDQKNYPEARRLLLQGLQKSPDYADLRVFLGRVYTWSDMPDSARTAFQYVLERKPDYEDASLAYGDEESWNGHYAEALTIIDNGLKYHPNSEALLLKRAHVQAAMKDYRSANVTLDRLIVINRNNTAARALQNVYRGELAANKIGIDYNFVYFDRQFSQPWHLASIEYGRVTPIGSVIGRVNYANRFGSNALQVEVDAYPHISKTFYAYMNLGFSGANNGVFPKVRAGFSLYANLPASFEAELGFRYLQFSGSPTWIYVAYLGKYYKSWLFGVRTYITPSTYTSTPSVSYSLIGTYYIGGRYDLIGGTVGYGLSPDDRYNVAQYSKTGAQLKTYKAGVFYKKTISTFNVISADFTWFNQEYLPQTKGNQYQIGVSWLHFF